MVFRRVVYVGDGDMGIVSMKTAIEVVEYMSLCRGRGWREGKEVWDRVFRTFEEGLEGSYL